jgi:poly-beta-1,6-N-acetyl-D-glucosamine biosynthesis protein PgaD
MRDLIIEKEHAQTKGQKYGYRLLTLVFWGTFLYLLRPLLTFLAWAVGISLFTEAMIEEGGWHGLAALLGLYAAVILVIALVLKTWEQYNLQRFRGRERRRQAPAVTIADMASRFGVDAGELLRWRQSRSLLLLHDHSGGIISGLTAEQSFEKMDTLPCPEEVSAGYAGGSAM